MEDKELPVDNVDKEIEAQMADIRDRTHQDYFTEESDPAFFMSDWHNFWCMGICSLCNVDQQMEAKMVDIRDQDHQDQVTEEEESDPALFMSNWHNLPDLAFDTIMMMVNVTSLRRCLQVCTSWKEKITQNIFENKTKKNIIRARMERALGPGMFPSAEEICNAKWLGK